MTQKRPQQGDYALYYENYVALVPSGDFLEILQNQRRELIEMLSPLSEEQAEFRYASGKWSIKEVIGHITDAERIFSYRLLRIARGDQTPLASFEQDGYIANGNFSARKLSDLLEEFSAVREATICLTRSLDHDAWLRRGTASQKEVSALALAFIIAGHERHHRLILEKRYLPALVRA
ncbi:MAG TPA: DinB family protein [Candidatus Acidoferrum sp.]|nr:DinB family protein [Candidatus Acidoferrum sp.]